MARKTRIEYSGAIHHVMSRGDHGEGIFKGEQDRELFLKTLGEVCQKTLWQVHAYCMLSNHFHLVVETPEANLVSGMKWFLGVYTARYNRRHKVFGHLFSGRYKALLVDGSGDGYLATVCHYVHLNPARAGLLGKGVALENYRWSSYREYLSPARQRPKWLRVDRLFGEMGIQSDSPAGRRRFSETMNQRLSGEQGIEYEKAHGGWYYGDEEFKEDLLDRVDEKRGKWASDQVFRGSGEQRAEKLVAVLLKERGWNEGDLLGRRKGDPEKVELARLLKEKTVMTTEWIASRLNMGTRQHLTFLLHRRGLPKRSRGITPHVNKTI